MACVALTSLMATIELEFLQPNHRVSLVDDDEKPLKSLLQKLSYMEAFVKKEYNNAVGTGATIRRHLLNKIRDFALKAEDAIEIQLTNILLLPKDGEEQKADEGELQLHQTLQQVAKDADELLNIINNIEVEVEDIIAASGGSISLQCSPHFDEDIIMVGGVRQYFRLLRRALLGNIRSSGSTRIVFSIAGVPGIGKTTLCKILYTYIAVVSHYDIQAWITIGQRYNGNVQQLLCHLLQSMSPTPLPLNHTLQGSTVSQLKHQLHQHLRCKRYLIVFDDVPNTQLWDDINQCFPDDSNGSWILLTTLFPDVAKYISQNSDVMNHGDFFGCCNTQQ